MDKNIKKYGIMAVLLGAGIGAGYLIWGRKTTTSAISGMRVSGCTTCGNNGLIKID